ncbi:MAG: hypothetical protein QF613_03015 [Candidatus Marinimicrobia bacterium]|nr:hypothetical protein [Candidatus Neomarinimicrobiota bacterium]
MRSSPLLLVVSSLLITSCSERERLNPLDPLNPATEGKPPAITLSSDEHSIFLSWSGIDLDGIKQFNIWRKDGSDPTDSVLIKVAPKMAEFIDTAPDYDVELNYRLSVETDGWESPLSDPESITPGPFNYWISDYWGTSVTRLSYDGGHQLYQSFDYFPVALQYDPVRSRVWVASHYPHRLVRLNDTGEAEFEIELDAPPLDMTINSTTGDIYLILANTSALQHFESNGTANEPVIIPFVLGNGAQIAMIQQTGTLWITEPDSSAVLKIDVTDPDNFTLFNDLQNPRVIAALQEKRTVWIATDSGLISVVDDDTFMTYLSGYYIVDLDINEAEESVWVVAYHSDSHSWTVIKMYESTGEWKSETVTTPFTDYISKIAVNPGLEHPGLLLYDELNREVVRVSPAGDELGRYGSFTFRLNIAVEQ